MRITIDEWHSMSLMEQDRLFEEAEQKQKDGTDPEGIIIDDMGLCPEEIAERYGYTEINEFFSGLIKELNERKDWFEKRNKDHRKI